MKNVFLSLLFMLFASFAKAHPHVWIYTDVAVHATDSDMDFLRVRWNFDEMYSSAIIVETDKDKDGYLNVEEQQSLFLDTFSNPEAIGMFMYFNFQGETVQAKTFDNFSATIEADESLTYVFDIYFDPHVKLGHVENKIGFFDPSQYIAFEQGLEMEFIGDKASKCKSSLVEEETITLALGFVHPEVYAVKCGV